MNKYRYTEILGKNAHLFDISDNLSLQSTAYFTEEINV